MERYSGTGAISRLERRREHEYWSEVQLTARRIAVRGGFARVDAEDIAQIVCGKLALRHGPDVETAPPLALVQHIAQRTMVDEWRRQGRRIRPRTSLDDRLYDGRPLAEVVAADGAEEDPTHVRAHERSEAAARGLDLPSGERLVAAVQDTASDWIESVQALTRLERSGEIAPITGCLIRGRLVGPVTWIADRIGVGEREVELVLRVHGPAAVFELEPEEAQPIEVLAARAGQTPAAARQRLSRAHRRPELARVVRLMLSPHTRMGD